MCSINNVQVMTLKTESHPVQNFEKLFGKVAAVFLQSSINIRRSNYRYKNSSHFSEMVKIGVHKSRQFETNCEITTIL